MASNETAPTITIFNEAAFAADLVTRTKEALKPFLALMDEAAARGLLVRFGGMAPGMLGKHEVVDLHIAKRF